MDLSHMYIKTRRDFGRQPMFSEVASHLLDSIPPNRAEQNDYVLRNPVHHESQTHTLMSEQYINTSKIEYTTKGTQHLEGGWPKEIDFNDEEATARYRRRIERDDDYVHAVLTLVPKLEYFIDQNNGIDFYQQYFKEMPNKNKFEEPSIKFYNIFEDPRKQQKKRPIACIDWTSENDSKLVVAYSKKTYALNDAYLNNEFTCYLWNIENFNEPMCEIIPPVACYQVSCSPSSPDTIIGGLADGTVCIFDIRVSKIPIAFSQIHLSHRDPVTALLYLQTRANNEFLSGSSDGTCIWYDIRNLSKPTDFLIMSINMTPGQWSNLANAEPVNVLQFDQALPTRFLCGTGTGLVINVNRKGKTHKDVMSGVYQAHTGPVKALHRSSCTLKMFITCGDWATHIWSEDIKTSPIVVGTPQRYQTQDVAWIPNRFSCYMTVGSDGKFRYWDILRKFREPIITLRLAKCSLLNIKCSANGHFVAIGDTEGSLHLLSLSESMITPMENEKQAMMQMYERETRRENILESRIKSIRLKVKADQETETEKDVDDETLVKEAENDYRRAVLEEIRRVDKIAWGG